LQRPDLRGNGVFKGCPVSYEIEHIDCSTAIAASARLSSRADMTTCAVAGSLAWDFQESSTVKSVCVLVLSENTHATAVRCCECDMVCYSDGKDRRANVSAISANLKAKRKVEVHPCELGQKTACCSRCGFRNDFLARTRQEGGLETSQKCSYWGDHQTPVHESHLRDLAMAAVPKRKTYGSQSGGLGNTK
jgi:hypothetical protein